jgi:hypothetical protein
MPNTHKHPTSNINSIHNEFQRLQAEGHRVSENALRLWVRRGELAHRKVGAKVLLNHETVLQFLRGEASPMPPEIMGGIRRVI